MRAHKKTGETGQQMNEPVNQFQIKDPNLNFHVILH